MTAKGLYAILHRTHARAWLCALALGSVWLSADAAPVNRGNVGQLGVSGNGRTTALTPGAPPVNSGGSTIPMSPSAGGWTHAGNYGVPVNATPPLSGTTVAGSGTVIYRDSYKNGQSSWDVNGVKYPAQVSTPVPWGAVAGGVAGVVCVVATAGACSIASGIAIATPYIMDWLGRAGLSRNPDTGAVEQPTVPDGYEKSDGRAYYIQWSGQTTGLKASQNLACVAAPAMVRAAYAAVGRTDVEVGASTLRGTFCDVQTSTGILNFDIVWGGASNCPAGWYVTPTGCYSEANLPRRSLTPDEVKDALSKVAPDSRVWGEALERGATINLPDPTVTGPTAIQGREVTTQNGDGTRQVSRTTYNFTTAGNTITNTSNVTTTTTYNTDNSVRSVSTTTSTPSEDEPKDDECEKRPNSVGCADLDTPGGAIPRDTRTITYAEETVFGGGSCPSDKDWTSGTLHASFKLVDWQTFCGYALPARALVILLALVAAFLIVMPGKEVRT